MGDFEDKITDAVVDGKITEHDADEVLNFASFLRATKGIPTSGPRSEEQRAAFMEAYRTHYPEDYAKAVAEAKARREEKNDE